MTTEEIGTTNHTDRDTSDETEVDPTEDNDKAVNVPANDSPQKITSNRVANDGDTTMTFALFVYWIVPSLLLAAFSRFGVDTSIGTIPVQPQLQQQQRNIAIQLDQDYIDSTPAVISAEYSSSPTMSTRDTSRSQNAPSDWPTAYYRVITDIEKRRRRWADHTGTESVSSPKSSSPSDQSIKTSSLSEAKTDAKTSAVTNKKTRGASTDPDRQRLTTKIDQMRKEYESSNSENIHEIIAFADALRFYDIQYRDGGSHQQEAMRVYDHAVELAVANRQALLDAGKSTNMDKNGRTNVNDEVVLPYDERSADGVLCGVYSSQGKLYFMANMFSKSVESYSRCIAVAPNYLDAINSRGSSLLILGEYKKAADDFIKVIKRDQKRLFSDAFTGLARILQADESVLPNGWDTIAPIVEHIIPQVEQQLQQYPQIKQVASTTLSRYHQTLFVYHDSKTKDLDKAWYHLTQSHEYKMSVLPPWQPNSELAKIRQSRQIFGAGFWPPGIGSDTLTPIFIIGFPRSGSTLLERLLDAHPLIVGTGENSVFNGRLDDIRNQIVKASVNKQHNLIGDLTRKLAGEVVEDMIERWDELNRNMEVEVDDSNPQRFVDKMLTNYNNVGFIHMLYPKALILHVYREPMDTVFSAYKHEFPSGALDYTSKFDSLAELYNAYREIIDHWDEVLPGRITHIRYEDMVNDMPGMARAIIESTGLPWNDGVLDFHKKKHAVNTMSTTQVRKGVYKDSMKSWKRYEDKLEELQRLIGKRVDIDILHRLQPKESYNREEL